MSREYRWSRFLVGCRACEYRWVSKAEDPECPECGSDDVFEADDEATRNFRRMEKQEERARVRVDAADPLTNDHEPPYEGRHNDPSWEAWRETRRNIRSGGEMRIEQRELKPKDRQKGIIYLNRVFDQFLKAPLCNDYFDWDCREMVCRLMREIAHT